MLHILGPKVIPLGPVFSRYALHGPFGFQMGLGVWGSGTKVPAFRFRL